MKSAKLPQTAGATLKPGESSNHAEMASPGRWSRWGRIAAATGFWFFLIKGLVWLAVFGAAVFLGIDVVQALEPPDHALPFTSIQQ